MLIRLIRTFLVFLFVGILSKPLFVFIYNDVIGDCSLTDTLSVISNGLCLDLAVAAYFMVVPMLLAIVRTWTDKWWVVQTERVYIAVVAFLYSLAIISNIALYGYWGFPLDSTPLFYLLTSPADAVASVSWLVVLMALAVIVLIAALIYAAIEWHRKDTNLTVVRQADISAGKVNKQKASVLRRSLLTLLLVLLTVSLVIPMRGGLTVAVNNVGTVYFSDNVRMNHAAVNPVFSFIESVSHEADFTSKYRFMEDDEASQLFGEMTYTKMRTAPDSLLTKKPRKVVMIVLESFSSYIMTERGNVKNVVPTIDRLAKEGVYFTNIYANSFRTDRGLMAILSGFPAQPTMSLMKYPKKTNNLYSIARSLRKDGYATHYVYGGDANFTNMRSYLMATGFNDVVSEEDYDAKDRTSKWGVNDSVLFSRKPQTLRPEGNEKLFYVYQTSSSHEPFEVPYHALENERLNAFQYTDLMLGRFLDDLRSSTDWDETLVILVPDHLGCYPQNLDNMQLYRYQIPLIMTGGVVRRPCRIDTIGSQHDIAATLLTLLDIDHSEFLYSKDILDPSAPHFAFFCVPDAMGMVTEENQVIYDNPSGKVILDKGKQGINLRKAQAYLQKIYDDIAGM